MSKQALKAQKNKTPGGFNMKLPEAKLHYFPRKSKGDDTLAHLRKVLRHSRIFSSTADHWHASCPTRGSARIIFHLRLDTFQPYLR